METDFSTRFLYNLCRIEWRDMKHLLLFFLCVSAFAERPNFILIYTDDQGWTDTSVEMIKGDPQTASQFYQTPHLEKMAKEGMRFSNAYAPAPTCTPSRISLQYGQSPARNGYMVVHDVVANNRGKDIFRKILSLPKALKKADENYLTAHFGKGMALLKMKDIGWDVTDEFDIGDNGNFHGDFVSIKNKVPLPEDDPKRVYSLAKRSKDFIMERGKDKKPFMLMLSHYAVHVDHRAKKETIEKYRQLPRGPKSKDMDYIDPAKMSQGFKDTSWTLQYAALIEHIDDSLGIIMKALKNAGLSENTYIIFTSDNGGGFSGNEPLKGGKANLFEGGLRVPFVVSGPGISADSQCDVPITQWDFISTIYDLAGGKEDLSAHLDGGSLKDLFFKGNSGKVNRSAPGLIFNYPYYAGVPIEAIRVGEFKLMRHLNSKEVKLFNVVKDKSEQENLAEKMPEKVKELDKLLQAYLRKHNSTTVDQMYKARENELNEWSNRALNEHKPKLEAQLLKTEDAVKKAQIELRLKAIEASLKRFEKSRQSLQEHMKNEAWN